MAKALHANQGKYLSCLKNEQNFAVFRPKSFCKKLLLYLGESALEIIPIQTISVFSVRSQSSPFAAGA
jgi:hypothetical protein